MAHFAEISSDNIVQRVIVVDNKDCLDSDGNESEAIGAAFCNNLLGGIWKQTSYNASFRKNYAGPGFKYDQMRDAFIPQQPYKSWVLNEDTCNWEAPVPYPNDEKIYLWNEISKQWEEIPLPA